MTFHNRHPSRIRPARPDAPTHLFVVGQTVRLRDMFNRSQSKTYRITGTMPARDSSPQYRIRHDEEGHERVTTQDTLEPVLISGDALIERTFGHGQRPEAQQS